MTTNVWPLQEAKNRFSELIESALHRGAQTVTRHGKPAVVIIPAEEYARTAARGKSLAAALRACPEDLTPLITRSRKQTARKVSL
jgi:antitoxin Phd